MATLMAPVKDGKVEQYDSEVTKKKSTRGSSELGKDAFLQLLVAQMKYQDPLEPSKDTEYISQLAQFSSLEQMQNLNGTMTNAQAFSYIGQNVIVSTNTDGNVKEIEGTVDYVTLSNGKAYVGINGNLYAASDVQTVVDPYFQIKQKIPSMEEQKVTYDWSDPEDVKIKLSLGSDVYAATGFAVVINSSEVSEEDAVIQSSYINYDKEKGILTISKDAFKNLESGTYPLAFVFNDSLGTSITDKVQLTIKGTKPETPTEETTEDGGTDEKDTKV